MAIVPIGPIFPVNPVVFSGHVYPIPSVDSLLQRLVAQAVNDNGLLDIADLITLSPEAQLILAGFNGTNSLIAGSGQVTEVPGFTLSNAQQQKITEIVLRYRDEPFNQDTFNSIQNDLRLAGLSPDQLALSDVARTANLDTTSLYLNALEGENSSLDFLFSQDGVSQQANADAYIRMIYNLWKATTNQPVIA